MLELNPNRYLFNAGLAVVNLLAALVCYSYGYMSGVRFNIFIAGLNGVFALINLAMRPHIKAIRRQHLIEDTIGIEE